MVASRIRRSDTWPWQQILLLRRAVARHRAMALLGSGLVLTQGAMAAMATPAGALTPPTTAEARAIAREA